MKTKQILALISLFMLFAATIFAQNAEFSKKNVVVWEPEFKNRAGDEDWIPSFVQGLVADNIKNHSDMNVIDRQRLSEIMREQQLSESETHSEKTRIEVGNLLAAQYIVFVSIIKKGSGYYLEYKMTNTATGSMAASQVNANCTSEDMNDGSAVNGDCRELLLKIGVNKSRLEDLSKDNIQKQKSEVLANEQIAKGIAAERAGNIVEAISFYQKALGSGAGMAEAASRMKSTTSNMVSGGVGANVVQMVQDEIAQLNRETDQWIKIYTDFIEMFQNTSVIEIYYHEKLPEPKRALGSTTIEYKGIECGFCINLEEISAVFETINDAFNSIDKERRDWYLSKSKNAKRLKELLPSPSSSAWNNIYNNASFEISLVNTNKKKIDSHKMEVGIVQRIFSYDGKITQRFFLGTKTKLAKNSANVEESLDEKDYFAYSLCSYSSDFLWTKTNEPFRLSNSPNSVEYGYGYCLKRPKTETASFMMGFDVSVYDYTEPLTLRIEMHNGTCQSYEQMERDIEAAKRERQAIANKEMMSAVAKNKGVLTQEIFRKYHPDYKTMKNYTIPEGVIKIGDETFRECMSLESVSIPESVTSIGPKTFRSCLLLVNVSIPNSVTSIGDFTFNGCMSLVNLSIPNSVTSIGNSAFSGCTSFESVSIPNSVTSIGSWTFSGCSSLKNVSIPNSVTSIGERAFYGCKSLKSVSIPNSVTSIGERAFEYCNSLASVTVLAKNPPKINGKIKYLFSTYANIYVPSESIVAYKKAWKYYKEYIQAIK